MIFTESMDAELMFSNTTYNASSMDNSGTDMYEQITKTLTVTGQAGIGLAIIITNTHKILRAVKVVKKQSI